MTKFTDKLTYKVFNKKNTLSLPETPGVYIFCDENKKPLYVGKSVSLKNRVNSYFIYDLGSKTAKLMSHVKFFSFIKVRSEIEALLLEAKLVRKFNTQYNIELKDDKNPLYIKITSDEYPRILTSRRITEDETNILTIGPFPSSSSVTYVLRSIRKVAPIALHKVEKRPCLRSQIGLCTPCPSYIESLSDSNLKLHFRRKYLANVRLVKKILSGEFDKVRSELVSKMIRSSKLEHFEEAADYKNRISALDYVTSSTIDPLKYIENPLLESDIREKELTNLLNILTKFTSVKKLRRVECFDIAHTSGSEVTASMVVFKDGEAEKSSYRHFRVHQPNRRSDTDSMTEIAKRRKKHLDDWGIPDLIIADGGKGQIGSFISVFGQSIPIIGLAKRFETILIPKDGNFISIRPRGSALNFMKKIRDESHRFARRYHHHLLKKKLKMI